jgi:hypothetical protein
LLSEFFELLELLLFEEVPLLRLLPLLLETDPLLLPWLLLRDETLLPFDETLLLRLCDLAAGADDL